MTLNTDPVSSTVLCTNCNQTFNPKFLNPVVSSDILRSHRPPSNTEASQTKSFIEEDRLELERYDVEIGRIRNILEKLEEERNVIWQGIQQRRSWLAPIRRLPTEVLEKILCFAREGTHSLTISEDGFDSPVFDLSQVCWYWMHIIMARPEWWRLMHVDIRGMSEDTLCLLKAYMEVSNSFELSIYIKDSGKSSWARQLQPDQWETYGEYVGTPGLCAFVAIFREARRIRDLTLEVPLDIFDQAAERDPDLFKDLTISFPLLRTVAFVEEVFHENSHLYEQLEISAPLLTEMTILKSNYTIYGTNFYRGWPLGRLSSLRTWKVIDIFDDFTQLERLDMSCQYGSSHRWDIVELSTIRHLTLRCSSSGCYDPFFVQVNLPALESLSFQQYGIVVNFAWPSTHFLDMLRRSTPTIKHIDFDFPYATLHSWRTANGDNSMLDFLKLCPDLEELHVNLKNSGALIASLQKLADASIRFPKLEDVVIRTVDIINETKEGKAERTMLEELLGRITAKIR
ncbi:hypothetical protein VNI00_009105 [Paramarasmius palmivorus]|uniref:F-box domain-containing protein n=1 Tax=Paramarasmius palmivorus TaxID=297713 RepID=A0AAW0CTT9_9AGAR